jgi:hypothetical protein
MGWPPAEASAAVLRRDFSRTQCRAPGPVRPTATPPEFGVNTGILTHETAPP